MKIYLAGPMSGIPQFNYPLFYQAADDIRARGHECHCPAEMDTPEMQAMALKSTEGNLKDLGETLVSWGDLLANDVRIVSDEVDGVCLLPDWFTSRGARLEAFVCITVQKPLYFYRHGYMLDMPYERAMQLITDNVLNQGDVSRYEEE